MDKIKDVFKEYEENLHILKGKIEEGNFNESTNDNKKSLEFKRNIFGALSILGICLLIYNVSLKGNILFYIISILCLVLGGGLLFKAQKDLKVFYYGKENEETIKKY